MIAGLLLSLGKKLLLSLPALRRNLVTPGRKRTYRRSDLIIGWIERIRIVDQALS